MTGFPAVNEGERYGTMQYLNDSHDEIKKIKAHYDFTMIPASKKKKEKKGTARLQYPRFCSKYSLVPNL
jgi:hypothetical protein